MRPNPFFSQADLRRSHRPAVIDPTTQLLDDTTARRIDDSTKTHPWVLVIFLLVALEEGSVFIFVFIRRHLITHLFLLIFIFIIVCMFLHSFC